MWYFSFGFTYPPKWMLIDKEITSHIYNKNNTFSLVHRLHCVTTHSAVVYEVFFAGGAKANAFQWQMEQMQCSSSMYECINRHVTLPTCMLAIGVDAAFMEGAALMCTRFSNIWTARMNLCLEMWNESLLGA